MKRRAFNIPNNTYISKFNSFKIQKDERVKNNESVEEFLQRGGKIKVMSKDLLKKKDTWNKYKNDVALRLRPNKKV